MASPPPFLASPISYVAKRSDITLRDLCVHTGGCDANGKLLSRSGSDSGGGSNSGGGSSGGSNIEGGGGGKGGNGGDDCAREEAAALRPSALGWLLRRVPGLRQVLSTAHTQQRAVFV